MGEEAQYLSETIGAEYDANKYFEEKKKQRESGTKKPRSFIPPFIPQFEHAEKIQNDLNLMRESRDYWRRRAEALERAVVSCEPCGCCAYQFKLGCDNCETCGPDYDWPKWQFDQARIEKGAGNEG